MINKVIKSLRSFGVYYTFIAIIASIFNKINPNFRISHLFHHYKYKLISKYINKKYSYIIEHASNDTPKTFINDSKYIWICWWQGIDQAPDIVKVCIDSVKKRYSNKKIIIIDQKNYSNYIDIPKIIIEKVNKGIFSITFFSDILRFCLLEKYGGVWIDSTIFLNKKVNMDGYSFFSVKHNLYSKWHVCRGKWSGFFIGASKNNCGIKLIRDILLAYAQNENALIAYLLVDAVIGIAYDNLSAFKKQVDAVPVNNSKIFVMQNELNDEFSSFLVPSDVNKLSYKFKYNLTVDHKETVYGELLNNIKENQ